MDEQKKKPGRKAKSDATRKKAHQVYATDSEWATIERMASEADMDVSPFVIDTVLNKTTPSQ